MTDRERFEKIKAGWGPGYVDMVWMIKAYENLMEQAMKLRQALDERSRDHTPYAAHDESTCDACIAIKAFDSLLEAE